MRCRELEITRSIGSVGGCFDNGMMESFFSSLEAEVLDRYRFETRNGARREIFSWIERGITPPSSQRTGIIFPLESSNGVPVRNMPYASPASVGDCCGEDGQTETKIGEEVIHSSRSKSDLCTETGQSHAAHVPSS